MRPLGSSVGTLASRGGSSSRTRDVPVLAPPRPIVHSANGGAAALVAVQQSAWFATRMLHLSTNACLFGLEFETLARPNEQHSVRGER